MSTYCDNDYSVTCARLEEALSDLNVRVRVSEQNAKLRESYEERIKTLNNSISIASSIIDILKPMLSDIQSYIDERKSTSMQNINNALRMAGDIIQDATEGIYFNVDNGEAWLSTPDGLEVDMVEGGGYRQISSTFIRSVILGTNPDILDTMILDEIFSLVSPENSAALSLYLNVMCQDKQVISIEQKPQVYSNIDSTMYIFSKDSDYAEVTKKVIKRGEENGGEKSLQAV